MDKLKIFFRQNKAVVTLCLLLVLSFGITGVVAYLTDADRANNAMTIGGNHIALTEEFIPPESLAPGIVIPKNVKVTNTGITSCYVRVFAEFTDSDMGQYCEVDWNTTDWVYNSGDQYWYYKNAIATGESTTSLFTTITLIDGDYEAVIKDFDVIVYAESYQSYGFDKYEDAWAHYQINKPVDANAVSGAALTAEVEEPATESQTKATEAAVVIVTEPDVTEDPSAEE